MNPLTITAQQLRQAANIQEQIQTLQQELNQLLGEQFGGDAGEMQPSRQEAKRTIAATARAAKSQWPKAKGAAPKRKLSAQGIANIRAGVLKRMAALKRAQPAAQPMRKRKVSAAGRARLSALAKARWAAARRAGKATL